MDKRPSPNIVILGKNAKAGNKSYVIKRVFIKEQRLAKLALISMRPLMKIPKSEPFFSVINK